MTMQITYWGDLGGATLTPEQIDQNFRSLADALSTLQAGLYKGIDRVEQDPASGTIIVYLSDGTYDGPFALPAKPINPVGARVVGANYVPGDLFTDSGSAYLVLRAHVSGADVAGDVTAGYVMLLVKAGRDAQVYQGDWDSSRSYAPGDVVNVRFDPNNQNVFDAYQAFDTAAAGADPRAGYPWGRLNQRPAKGIEKELSAKPLAGQVLRYMVSGAGNGAYVPKGGLGSYAAFAAPPAAAYTVTINRRAGGPAGTLSAIGTITFAAGSGVGTFNLAAYVSLPPGDVIEFVFPATQDSAAAVFVMNMAIY